MAVVSITNGTAKGQRACWDFAFGANAAKFYSEMLNQKVNHHPLFRRGNASVETGSRAVRYGAPYTHPSPL